MVISTLLTTSIINTFTIVLKLGEMRLKSDGEALNLRLKICDFNNVFGDFINFEYPNYQVSEFPKLSLSIYQNTLRSPSYKLFTFPL